MRDRMHTSMPLVGELPPERSGRDPRIDACRGIALWWIFLDHIPNNVGSWLTLRNYGFCDAAEVFMFISGVTCALAYGKARRCEGWSHVIRRSLRRGWDIYAAFLLLTLACVIMVYVAGRDQLADESNTRVLLEHPGVALAHAAILQYRPVNTDILPIFVVYHVLFAPLLWLLLRVPNVTLGASLLLYALVHVFGWTIPAWPNNVWFFNPLAWQLLIVLGAWWVVGGKRLPSWVTSRTALVLAVLYLAFSLIIALSWSIKSLEPLVPQRLTNLLFPVDKSNLSPLRVLHFLALVILAARFLPHTWRGLMTPVMRGATRCGENSLPIYCLGVLLALASHVALLDISDGVPMQIALSLGGILMMIVAAMLLSSITIKPKRQPPHDETPAHGDFKLVGSPEFLKSSWRILRARRLAKLRKIHRWMTAGDVRNGSRTTKLKVSVIEREGSRRFPLCRVSGRASDDHPHSPEQGFTGQWAPIPCSVGQQWRPASAGMQSTARRLLAPWRWR